MKKMLLALAMGLLLLSCGTDDDNQSPFSLQGAWVLTQRVYPSGDIDVFSANERTLLRWYEGDSMVYEFHLTQAEHVLMVTPVTKCGVTLRYKGGGEYIYLEEENLRPLSVVSDSTITIQSMGIVYTLRRADNIAQEWGTEIRAIIDRDMKGEITSDTPMRGYVLSTTERQQNSLIHGLVYAIAAAVMLVLVVAQIALANRRAKQRLRLLLQQIHEEHNERPQQVRQAIVSVEWAFFSSDEYKALQQRIATGMLLEKKEWDEIEALLKKVYPGFTSQLRSLYVMSELEYQTCLLIKLRIAPRDMALVMNRDMSIISTVRSRLYQKVFGRKGGAREWDNFVLSIGA
ncbi:MAG: hypothetical protein K2H04_11265 [Bacteroidaceae bacterium]|nr:hypothetical protein [Bacteroidaceae bacterium]